MCLNLCESFDLGRLMCVLVCLNLCESLDLGRLMCVLVCVLGSGQVDVCPCVLELV